MRKAKIRALIVDQDAERAARLKNTMKRANVFRGTESVRSTHKALKGIKDKKALDIVFFSASFSDTLLYDFVSGFKAAMEKRKSIPLVLLAAGKEQSRALIEAKLLAGFSAVLVEPYSVESLLEVCELARMMKEEKSDTLIKPALNDLVSSAMSFIDEVALRKAAGKSETEARKELENVATALRHMDIEQIRHYSSIIGPKLEKAKAPKQSPRALKEEAQRKAEEQAKKDAEREAKQKEQYQVIRR